jgi:hypothetical protein
VRAKSRAGRDAVSLEASTRDVGSGIVEERIGWPRKN